MATLWVLLIPGLANVTTFYVSPLGDGVNPGTIATLAWRTDARVNVAALLAGDVSRFKSEGI